ncbi:MAG: ABC transporter ATP-binding protein [Actinomycetota bacterium]|nr:ABC transporter ATP-binding protein [Actinomycetota bacterium]
MGRGRSRGVLNAVRGVSVDLHRRAVVALVGESGSGKSTVAKLLAGQERATGGRIELEGSAVDASHRRDFRAYKSSVQMVFQDPFSSLNPVHTVRYHLARPVRLHRSLRGRDALESALVELVEQVRLTPASQFLAKYPHELSGGQRQRVAIARALAARPSVLLADEPVSMLDVSIRLEVLGLISELRDRYDLAVLYITHDIASARYFADEALVMYAGEIVERGPAESVTQAPAHPYTQLLVSSAPDPDALGSVLRSGSSAAPRSAGSALSTVRGCRFSARCPLAEERCRNESPPLARIAHDRAAACWRVDVAAPGLVEAHGGGGVEAMTD